MQISRETPELYTIKSYSDHEILVNDTHYHESLVIGRNRIHSPWPVKAMLDLTETSIHPILEMHPEVILIGHTGFREQISPVLVQYLSTLRIGIECMSIGAACRTFNVLLGEQRNVVAGFILSQREF
jgi:uncharacterized protein